MPPPGFSTLSLLFSHRGRRLLARRWLTPRLQMHTVEAGSLRTSAELLAHCYYEDFWPGNV